MFLSVYWIVNMFPQMKGDNGSKQIPTKKVKKKKIIDAVPYQKFPCFTGIDAIVILDAVYGL